MKKSVHGHNYIYCDHVGCTDKVKVDTFDDDITGWGVRVDGNHYCNLHFMSEYESGSFEEERIWTEDWKETKNQVVVLYCDDKSITLIRPASLEHLRKVIVIYQDAAGNIESNVMSISEVSETYTIPIKVLRNYDLGFEDIPSAEEYERYTKEKELIEKIHGK